MEISRLIEMAIGLGLVIFVHELGHFLVARWCGVLVERFSIGFGPVILSFKSGDTEYALSLIPLGGYVKMLGQHDTPEALEPTDDPRSYQNKSVGKRMAIISAGVVMNVIFGFVCFAVAYHMGVPVIPARVGAALPGFPAWEAGLRTGDNLVSINGIKNADFQDLMMEVALTKPKGDPVEFEVERQGTTFPLSIRPAREASRPIIGVLPALGLELYKKSPLFDNSSAGRANPGFQGDDRIVSVNGEPVASHYDFTTRMHRLRKEPVKIGVERAGKDKAIEKLQIAVEPTLIRTFGLEMTPSEIVAVQENSPASRAVDAQGKPAAIHPNDVIKAVDGNSEIDPLRLADYLAERAGKPVALTLLRPGSQQKEVTVLVTPNDLAPWIDFPEDPGVNLNEKTPMGIPAIGVAMRISPIVRRVAKGGPAATASTPVQPGDVLKKASFHFQFLNEDKSVVMDAKEELWTSLFWAIQMPMVRNVTLTFDRPAASSFEIVLDPTADPEKSWYFRHRGLLFSNAVAEKKSEAAFDSVRFGFMRTRSSIINLYLTLRGLLMGYISPKNLHGPISIAQAAYYNAESLPALIAFLALLNINLAVINFLPIPILDGGHMFFLTYELIFRKPPSDRLVLAANYLGLAMILSLMIFVLSLDVLRLRGAL